MLSVDQARARILAALSPLPGEQIGLSEALGRVLAEDLAARRAQPPADVSAMDGYAVRHADLAPLPARLKLAGHVPAGSGYDGTLKPGEAVRIFTGAPVPRGADTVVVQEDTQNEGERVRIDAAPAKGRHIRRAGGDFQAGETLLKAGAVLSARAVGLAAAMNRPWLMVHRRPRVAILSSGDEIVMPGDPVGPNQIVSANGLALAAAVRLFGGEPISLGIAPDDRAALAAMAEGARGADLLLTSGGASVGEHDLIREVLGDGGAALDFWRIAMRPGKPLMFGRLGAVPLLGLPGNPVSSLVCALLFLKPALERLSGLPGAAPARVEARLAAAMPANDRREDYVRARLEREADGRWTATPFPVQDSAMLRVLADAGGLIVRPPQSPALDVGAAVSVLPFPNGFAGF